MSTVFCAPLSLIALYESYIVHGRGKLRDYFADPPPPDYGEEENPLLLDPGQYDPAGKISKVPFCQLEQMLPK